MEIVNGKGILEQIGETNTERSPRTFTVQDFKDAMDAIRRRDYNNSTTIYTNGVWLLSIGDTYFESMVKSNITVMCGTEVAEKIKERIKKLNIEL